MSTEANQSMPCKYCGTELTAEQASSQQAAKVQGKIVCNICQPEIIEKIKAKQAAAKEGAQAQATAGAGRKKVAKKASGRAPKKIGAKGRVAPGKKTAAPAKPSGRPQVGAKGNQGSTRPAVGGKASKVGKVGKRGAGKVAGREPEAAAEVESGPIQIKKPSKAPLFIGIGVLVVIAAIGGYFLTQTETEQPVVQNEPKKPKIDPKEEARKRLEAELARAKEFASENPDDFIQTYNLFLGILHDAERNQFNDLAQQAQELADASDNRHKERALEILRMRRQKVEELQREDEFERAYNVVKRTPDVILSLTGGSEESSPQAKFKELQADAEFHHEAWTNLTELRDKALEQARKDYADIAQAVLLNFNEDYESTAPKVWSRFVDIQNEIRKGSIAALLEVEEKKAEEARRQAELARIEAEKERKRRWKEKKDQIRWVSYLGNYNLYNWVICSEPLPGMRSEVFDFKTENGEGVLICRTSGSGGGFIGPYTANWQDYVLRFEVKIDRGGIDLALRARGTVGQGRGSVTESADRYTLDKEKLPEGEWVQVSAEVQGEEIRIFVSGQLVDTLKYEDNLMSMPASGGFVFYTLAESDVSIRKVQAKVVNPILW